MIQANFWSKPTSKKMSPNLAFKAAKKELRPLLPLVDQGCGNHHEFLLILTALLTIGVCGCIVNFVLLMWTSKKRQTLCWFSAHRAPYIFCNLVSSGGAGSAFTHHVCDQE